MNPKASSSNSNGFTVSTHPEKMKPKNTDQETEDRKPSIDDLLARSHKRKRKKARKEADDPNENNNHTEPLAEATVNRPSKWTDQLVEVAKTSYRGYIITIYAEGLLNGNRRFYFEPLALLDPSSIASESHVLLKKDFVRFSVQMWTADLRSKVHSTLMSLNHADVREENVHVMPYEEVQLKLNCSLFSFMLMKEPTFYSRMNENLDFYFLCDSPETAVTLAQDFRRNPEFSLKSFRLQMECKGLTLRNPLLERPYFVFNVSSLPRDRAVESLAIGPGSESSGLNRTEITSNIVPVFAAKKCINPEALHGESFGFSSLEFETKEEHGSFDLPTGIFTAKTEGIYQFNFSGHVSVDDLTECHHFILKVDNTIKAVFFSRLSPIHDLELFQPAVINSIVSLKSGQKVGVYVNVGQIYQGLPSFVTQFSGILYAATGSDNFGN